MKKGLTLISWAAIMLAACGGKQTNSVSDAQASDTIVTDSQTVGQEITIYPAIDRYLAESIGSAYAEGEYSVPIHTIVGVDESNAEDIKAWGDFWVFNYNLVGDTLKCVSGGNHPGLMHLQKTEKGFEVTAFDQVEDGSKNLPTAKKIFGDKFKAFQDVNSDGQRREKLRAEVLAVFVKKRGLTATHYQDIGWPAKKLGE